MKNRWIAILVVAMLAVVAAVPVAAQDYPVNTITVTGEGSAAGSPDIAEIIIGVRTVAPQASDAFTTNNATVSTVIDAVVAAGVAQEDVSTFSIYAYTREDYPPFAGGNAENPSQPQRSIEVSNDLKIIVRDTSIVGEVISAAVLAGANNINGLNFRFSNQTELERQARAQAVEDARAQAQEYADLAGVQLGDIIIINEGGNGGRFPVAYEGMGGGGVPTQPGQLSVNVQVEVTFSVNR